MVFGMYLESWRETVAEGFPGRQVSVSMTRDGAIELAIDSHVCRFNLADCPGELFARALDIRLAEAEVRIANPDVP